MKCDSCLEKLKKGDKYIEYEGSRYCGDCYKEHTFTTYTIDGNYLATSDDGVLEYDKYDEEEGV